MAFRRVRNLCLVTRCRPQRWVLISLVTLALSAVLLLRETTAEPGVLPGEAL